MSSTKVFQTSVVLSAVDKMTRVVNRAFKSADRRLVNFQKKADKIAERAAKTGRTAAAIGLSVLTPLALASKKAINFEESMADVSKVLNLQRGSQELNRMADGAQKLGIHLAKSPNKAAEMIAALAQGGAAKSELFKIGKFTGEMSVAFDIMANSAGDSFMKTKNALGITTEATMDVMNAVNFLSDNVAAKAPQILTSLSQGGAAAARMMKISGQESAALGATFIAMGKSGSEAGTLIAAMSRGLGKNNQISKIFRNEGGGMKGILKVLEVGNKLSGAKKSAFFSQFGLYGSQIALAAENTELLAKSVGLATDKTKTAASVAAEFANRSNTRAFELQRVQSQLEVTGIKIGNALLPVISKLATALTPMLNRLAIWIEKNPKLTEQIVKGALAFGAANMAVSGLSFGVSGVSKTLSFMSQVMRVATKVGMFFMLVMTKPTAMIRLLKMRLLGLTKVIRLIGLTMANVGRALIANPVGIAIMVVAGLAFLLWKYWKPIKGFFVRLWAGITKAFNRASLVMSGVKKRFFNAGKNIMKSLWNGLKSLAMKPVEMIANIVKKMRDYLPFSPAKVGPFKDLHRVKIIETIVSSMNPITAAKAMKRTVNAMVNVGASGQRLSPSVVGNAGGGIVINFNPSISFGGIENGGDVKSQIIEGLKHYSDELLAMIDDARRRQGRKMF